MTPKLNEYPISENEPIQFLNDKELDKLELADANPFVKISTPDKSIPFIVLTDGGVVADITANNPKTVAENFRSIIPSDKLYGGAGFMDIYHGNKTLVFRHVESSIFEKKWHVDDIISALQSELNLYYPGYQVRSR